MSENQFTCQQKHVDYCLKSIVETDDRVSLANGKISWIQVSRRLFKVHGIDLLPKTCESRYKNYLSNKFNPHARIPCELEEKVFEYHCNGQTSNTIRKNIGNYQLNQNSFKNYYKKEKEAMARIIWKVFSNRKSKYFQEAEQQLEKIMQKQGCYFSSPQNHFRVFLILFSKSSLLKYYKATLNGVSVPQLRKHTIELKSINQQLSSKKSDKKVLKKKTDYQNSIISKLQRITSKFGQLYENGSKNNSLISKKDKLLEFKYKCVKSIVWDVPMEQIKDEFIEKENDYLDISMPINNNFQGINFEQSMLVNDQQLYENNCSNYFLDSWPLKQTFQPEPLISHGPNIKKEIFSRTSIEQEIEKYTSSN